MTFATRVPLTLLTSASLALGQISIQEIKVEGNQRLPAAGIVAASGLKLKTTVSAAQLAEAVQKLASTGLFTTGSYKYGPSGTGSVVTLVIAEEKATAKVVLDIPALDEATFWPAMAGTLIDKVVPPNSDATAFYAKAMQDYLAKANHPEEIRESDETDLQSGSATAVFVPAHRPMVAGLRFTGNRAIPEKTLQDLTARLIVDNPYSDREDHAILEANLRPVYEEKGFLKVAFPVIAAEKGTEGKVILTATVDEGKAWMLGTVTPSGDGVEPAAALRATALKKGDLANWKAVSEGVDRMLNDFRATGYIGARAATRRTFHDDSGTVDVSVSINRGRMFRFERLEITGLSDSDKRKAENLWKLQPGVPMNSPYVDEFLKAVFQNVKPPVKSVAPDLKVNGDNVTVAIAFSGSR